MSQCSLTAKQAQLLAFITESIEATGVAPSYEAMKAHCGISSKSGIHRMITALEERVRIARIPGRARAITVLGYLSGVPTFELEAELHRRRAAA